MGRVRTTAVIVSIILHVGTAGGLVYLSGNQVEGGGGDTPLEISLDPSAASGGNGPPVDAGPSAPPPQVAESAPPPVPSSSEPPPVEEKPTEAPVPTPTTPPPEERKETPPTQEEAPPPVVKSAPDSETKEVVATDAPPPATPPPATPPPKPVPPPPPRQAQEAVDGGTAGGAAATGSARTEKVGSAIDPGAQRSCAKAIQARLRRPQGLTPRPFRVQMVVAASGAILSVTLLSSSGSPVADQEAIRAFRSSGPFPPCPRIGPSIQLETWVVNKRR